MIPVKSCTRVVLASLVDQMLLPAIYSRIYVQMAQRAPVGSSKRLGGKAFLLLSVGFVRFLVDCFFAPWAFLVVFAVGALSDQMRGEGVDFDALAALAADDEHGACVEIVHVFVILLHESFVDSFAKLANYILVGVVLVFALAFFGNLDELVTHVQLLLLLLLLFVSGLGVVGFRLDGFLVEILRLLHASCFI